MNQESRWSNEIGKQDGGCRKDASSQAIEPNPSAHKEIPGQHVRPFFGDKVGILGDHTHEGLLGIARGIKDVVEFGQRSRHAGALLDNAAGDNQEMYQTTQEWDF